jgi:F420-0:gamma-glutamyl ligase
MEVIGVRTRILNPPKDDFYEVLRESLRDVRDGDIVLVSSKVLAIHQGRCISVKDTSLDDLVEKESEGVISYYNEVLKKHFRITLKQSTLISSAGIDQSNGNGYYILWPEHSTEFCKEIRAYLCERFSLSRLAVICVDSHSLPLRYGAVGIAIGYYGMKPLKHYKGKKDLFQRKFKVERSNLIDMLASSGTLVMGEGREQMPIAIVRNMEGIEFIDYDSREEFFVEPENDMYWPMLKVFKKGENEK